MLLIVGKTEEDEAIQVLPIFIDVSLRPLNAFLKEFEVLSGNIVEESRYSDDMSLTRCDPLLHIVTKKKDSDLIMPSLSWKNFHATAEVFENAWLIASRLLFQTLFSSVHLWHWSLPELPCTIHAAQWNSNVRPWWSKLTIRSRSVFMNEKQRLISVVNSL